ncbi:MAG: rhodanese-related sulfurtransferase [Salibacteraceae bacterium]|jgi:rhodanese-related sulfurtransferase
MDKFLFTIVAVFTTTLSFSQTVEDRGYSAKLQKLLSHTVPEVSVSEVDTNESIVFVDAREENEYKVSHIKKAVWVGYDKLNLSKLKDTHKNQKIIVYCSVGYRSEKVSEKLIKQGFTDVSNLYGGIFEWKNRGRPVYENETQTTEKVHAYDKTWGQWLRRGQKCY